ncbi:MAG: FAD-binding protein [Streptosporangiales bacterium]|nr:FAD-binding protein [Streptosporangiales bacterium]
MTGDATRTDLAVVGSGSAAFAAAIAASSRGLDVVMVERGTVGGTCVNTGCIPSKALLAAATARHGALAGGFPGVTTTAARPDWPALAGGTFDLVDEMRSAKYTDLATAYGWRLVAGTASFTGDAAAPALHIDLAAGGTLRVEAAHYLHRARPRGARGSIAAVRRRLTGTSP